ncbi:putative Polycomb group protein ASXL2 isoform X2 [Oryzias melastigma]|uniref:putative Polycomb group protein ASXL2 isoform X2 n=2 Tax=Oryzias melastigma TaxID=30732 RepID=UPI000CF803D6|nr:putative Polycomb group protein ASXL2 isoform X2 [Oryzias melastigma]
MQSRPFWSRGFSRLVQHGSRSDSGTARVAEFSLKWTSQTPLHRGTSTMRERQKRRKGRTWAEAAKTVLEKYPNTPMSHKEILQVIQRERLKEISGTSPLACLNAMLHTNSRGKEGIFYKVPGRMGVYTLKKDVSETVKELSDEDDSEDSSGNLSDSRNVENSGVCREMRTGRWMRRVSSKLQSQPPSPQPRCSSPPVPAGKLISPSQKHSKKALRQALKQQRHQCRQVGGPAGSSPRLLLKTIKDMAENISAKSDLCHAAVPRKTSQRSTRLSAGPIKRSRCKIDVETPDSILVNTNLRAIINKHTLSVLPHDCQQKLLRLLPAVDRQACLDGLLKITSSALNNEFFASAAQAWKERLGEGEFTPELQLRLRQETEKEKKVELWKEAFFENFYGEKLGLSFQESKALTQPALDYKFKAGAKQEENSNPLKAKSKLMKTRCSHHTEEPKNAAPLSGSGHVDSVDLWKSEELSSPPKLPKPEHKEESNETESTLKTGSDIKEDLLVSEETPAAHSLEFTPQPRSPSPALKRRSASEADNGLRAEKRSRFSSVSSASSASPSASSTPSTPSPTNQRVPPLKIPVSRILPRQIGQGSPPFSSLARTGARTLADIKAKAQLARAQRAAAGLSKAVGPGPGLGGSSSQQPYSTPSSPQEPSRLPATGRFSSSPSSRPLNSMALLSPDQLQTPQLSRPAHNHGVCPPGEVGKASEEVQASSSDAGKEVPGHRPCVRSSSCIPANNPLVTQLLQGKDVPLEQILPKPVSRGDTRTTNMPPSTKAPPTAELRMEKQATPGAGSRIHRELPNKETQEQILQTLMQRKVQPAPPQHKLLQLSLSEDPQELSKVTCGFLGRKRVPRPAMTGHYLLNVSTYGRRGECRRLLHLPPPNKPECLKRERKDHEDDVGGTVLVKTEQEGVPELPPDEEERLLPPSSLKTEPGAGEVGVGVGDTTKDKNVQLHRRSGGWEPCPPPTDHTRQIHRSLEDSLSCYRGAISMSVPHISAGSPPPAEPGVGAMHGSVMSFSVTVTTIPAASQAEPQPAFSEGGAVEEVPSRCYCRLKAMIVCRGCGAFCHHDCIGPSRLCVSCLVIR